MVLPTCCGEDRYCPCMVKAPVSTASSAQGSETEGIPPGQVSVPSQNSLVPIYSRGSKEQAPCMGNH